MPEIEAKILDIDPDRLRLRLAELGAPRSFAGELHAIFFSHPADDLAARGAVLRLRREGEATVLTYKERMPDHDPALKVLDEREVGVADFAGMREILRGLGYREMKSTRKFREQFELPGAHVVIDSYREELAYIPVFCEIEAASEARLYAVAETLGYTRDQLSAMNSFELAAHYAKR
ncbi:MAG: class IV adenylate cyclase [Bacteroidota bacterium]